MMPNSLLKTAGYYAVAGLASIIGTFAGMALWPIMAESKFGQNVGNKISEVLNK